MGGAIAAQMALDAPGRIASLSLIASAGLGAEINAGYLEGFVGAATRRELKPVIEQLFAARQVGKCAEDPRGERPAFICGAPQRSPGAMAGSFSTRHSRCTA